VGAWPVDLDLDDDDGLRSFVRRLVLWQTKALREAKVSSSWFTPDYWYEQRAEDFLISLVLEHENHMLIRDIGRFAQYIAPAGALNSLAQLVMRLTFPGVPDLYQGTEWWDFSLVDPDNRTPVDFAARERALAELDGDVMLAAGDTRAAG
jgi:(1->4)-alpha-D-glucan 1-alpha-D-glucosylmutase